MLSFVIVLTFGRLYICGIELLNHLNQGNMETIQLILIALGIVTEDGSF